MAGFWVFVDRAVGLLMGLMRPVRAGSQESPPSLWPEWQEGSHAHWGSDWEAMRQIRPGGEDGRFHLGHSISRFRCLLHMQVEIDDWM